MDAAIGIVLVHRELLPLASVEAGHAVPAQAKPQRAFAFVVTEYCIQAGKVNRKWRDFGGAPSGFIVDVEPTVAERSAGPSRPFGVIIETENGVDVETVRLSKGGPPLGIGVVAADAGLRSGPQNPLGIDQ